MSTWNKIFGPTVWGAKSSRQMNLFKTIRQSPYLIGAAVSYVARSDGPSVFPEVKPSSPDNSQSTFRRTLSEDEWWRF